LHVVEGILGGRTATAALAMVLALAGCAAPPLAVTEDWHGRARTQTEGGLTVTTSVLSEAESLEVYGVPLGDRSIQPVWVEVTNGEDVPYWLLSPGLDPNFFPASEAAEAFAPASAEGSAELSAAFEGLAFRNPIPPGATVSGFVLTNLDEGVKLVLVDLVSDGRQKSFSFLALVPGLRTDYANSGVFKGGLYAPEEIVEIDEEADLRAALEALPCCVTNSGGSRNGDPLNLIIVGDFADAAPAFVRRGWGPTEVTWTGSLLRMAESVLEGERYRYSPVSNLYLYERPQDFALQKARDNIHQRNHLRLWLSPIRYQGKPVWVGQISRDIGSRLTIHSPTFTTHKIDPDVDEARGALLEDMAYSQALTHIAYVKGVGASTPDAPAENLTTDPYYTDGLRVVMFLNKAPVSLTEISFLAWETRPRDAARAAP
jgi:hypothetical protein